MLEVIALSVEDAKAIEYGGGERIELVSGISEGGLTPSYGMIEEVVKSVSIPVNVMIRPHGYHFSYSKDDLKVMKKDIQNIQSLGVNGLVLGVLNEKKVYQSALNDLLENITCDVTFHRAIDDTLDIFDAYQTLCDHESVSQILTSGGPGKAADHLMILDKLYSYHSTKLLLGSGITLNNIATFVKRYPKANYHVGSDARVNQTYNNRIDEKHIRLIVEAIEKNQAIVAK